jgi:4-hydroxy-tetrahydrodipicolinate reductase
MKILLNGMCGFMGNEVLKLCKENYLDCQVVCGVDAFCTEQGETPCFKSYNEVNIDADCIVDFSHHSVTKDLLKFAVSKKLPLVLCTTGHTDDEKQAIFEASKQIPIFYSANMSIGVSLLVELAKKVAISMPNADIEIIEKHHNRKVDAPSGTALMFYDAIKEVRQNATAVMGRSGQSKRTKEEIGIHSLRMANVVGEHQVIVATANQTITLKHEAHNRGLFAEGALTASVYLVKQVAGLYNMKSMLQE